MVAGDFDNSEFYGIWRSTILELNDFWKVLGTNLGQKVKFSEKKET